VNVAVQVVSPAIGIVVVVAWESEALQLRAHDTNFCPAPGVAIRPTVVIVAGTV